MNWSWLFFNVQLRCCILRITMNWRWLPLFNCTIALLYTHNYHELEVVAHQCTIALLYTQNYHELEVVALIQCTIALVYIQNLNLQWIECIPPCVLTPLPSTGASEWIKSWWPWSRMLAFLIFVIYFLARILHTLPMLINIIKMVSTLLLHYFHFVLCAHITRCSFALYFGFHIYILGSTI